MESKIYKNIIRGIVVLFILVLVLGISYTAWNAASPERTCASCHEISPSHTTWSASAHRDISCFECHGTALENGWHSLSEKARMVVRHVQNKPHPDDIRMTEAQIFETMDRCIGCHRKEHANWLAGGHSATYADILLHEGHNKKEQLNFDCLRCHGMFNAGTILDVVEPISIEGPWKMKDEKLASKPTMPCMTCHQIHSKGEPAQRPDYSMPGNIFYGRNMENNSIGLYVRNEKTHFDLANLPSPVILLGNDTVKTPADPVYRLCVQCHAPSVWHQAGSHDDRTPTGVHEGISCRACHEPHSNYQRNSCDKCHPGISNCNLDVKTMNTSYFSPSSPHNIHSVACTDCHENK
jgi:hypothetical protein